MVDDAADNGYEKMMTMDSEHAGDHEWRMVLLVDDAADDSDDDNDDDGDRFI